MFNKKNNNTSYTIISYILKDFIKIFLLIYATIFVLIFIADYFEFISKGKNQLVPFMIGLKITFYRIPNMIENFVQFIILLSSSITIKKLSVKKELTILYTNGFSLWKILKIFSILTIIISFFSILITNPIFLKMSKRSKKIELLYIKKENFDFLEPRNGIWLEQLDIKNNNKIFLRSNKVYLDEMIFKKNILLIIDENNNFLKRISSEELKLFDGFWLAKNNYTTEYNKNIQFNEQMSISTNLKKDFVMQKIMNKYDNIDYMSLYKLLAYIGNFKKYKLDCSKYIVKINTILILPFVCVLMNFISCIFITNNTRINSSVLEIFKVVVVGIAFFIIQNITSELVLAKKIDIYYLWCLLSVSYLLCYYKLIKKIELQNV